MRLTQRPRAAPSPSAPPTAPATPHPLMRSPLRALALPAAFALALVTLALFPPVRPHPALLPAFLGAAGVLLAWSAGLYAAARRTERTLTLQVALYKHHWVQACAQAVVLLYWGWHTPIVFAFLPLLLAQLLFAYGVDSLLAWSRRDAYALGFGPFPVVFSINLFLWFRPDWFYLQFLLILVGYLGKELIRWQRDGRSAHIFNPSSFPLAIAALVLLLTGTSDITFGRLIANTQHDPPYIYLVIFLAALPGQLLFGVARMTLPAVLTTYLTSQIYFQATGTYLFFDSHIPVPVFLGMHLLFTDPSTSPRSESGRILFGVLYGLAAAGLYVMLSSLGAPTFYDKLLPVPILNLLVRRIDRLATSAPLAALLPAGARASAGSPRRHAAYAAAWAAVFLALSSVRALGDRHPGQYLPFWQAACETGSERACRYASFMTLTYCNNGSGWACNEVGVALAGRGGSAGPAFERGCRLGFTPACDNLGRAAGGAGSLVRAAPLLPDLPIVLRGTKPALHDWSPTELYELACEQGWSSVCGPR